MHGLLQLLDMPPQEVAGLQHLALLLQTVNEWLCIVGSQGRPVQRTLVQIQADYNLNERFVAWLDAAIRQTANKVRDRHMVDEVCHVARRADRWAAQLGQALGPMLSNLATCGSAVHRSGVVAMGQLASSCAALALVLLPHVAQVLGDGNGSVRCRAVQAMGNLVNAAPDLAA